MLTQAAPSPGAASSNYHGYATQDFLAVDPRFGTPTTCAGWWRKPTRPGCG